MKPTFIAFVLAFATTAAAGPPQLDYMLHCQGCHRADGSGTPGSIPALDGFVARFLHVPGGREYLVRVPGSAQSALDDAALADLLNWIVRRFGPAEDAAAAAAYTAAEITRIRRPPLVDVDDLRAALVAQMSPREGALP
jgi:hypothetical protein